MLGAAVAAAPICARAEGELQLGLETAVEYDDNVLYQPDDPRSDFSLRIGPRIHAYDTRGHLQWDFHYYPNYEKFADLTDLDGWDHDVLLGLTWQASERTALRVHEQYYDLNRAVRLLGQTDVTAPGGDVDPRLGRQGFQQNVALAELTHRLTRRSELGLRFDNVLSENEEVANFVASEGNVSSVHLSWLYDLRPRDRAGLVLGVTRQVFEREDLETRTTYYNPALSWSHAFDPTLFLSASVGPAFVDTDTPVQDPVLQDRPVFPFLRNESGVAAPVRASSCPSLGDGTRFFGEGCRAFDEFAGLEVTPALVAPLAVPTRDLTLIGGLPSGTDSDVTYFAQIALTKDWSTVVATLRYVRDASTTAERGGRVRDAIQANLAWRPTERWTLRFLASYERSEFATELTSFVEALEPSTAAVPITVGIDDDGDGRPDRSVIRLVSQPDVATAVGLRAVPLEDELRDERVVFTLNVEYRLTKRLSLFSRTLWSSEDSSSRVVDTTTDRFNVGVGLRYYFDPIQLPI